MYIYIYIYIGGHDAQKRQTDKAAFVYSRTRNVVYYIITHYQTVYCSSRRMTPPRVQFVRIMYHNILRRVRRVSWTTHIRYTGKIKKAQTRCPGEKFTHIVLVHCTA